ncbi:DUF7617 domain-containing protein [Longispora albida]|uniref:DUF7617 domain-containing protein n=1 Tax=Longispora albida TaxID=203523 RepID=UPI00035FE506|nr:hypothetical protein [Longispora albida]
MILGALARLGAIALAATGALALLAPPAAQAAVIKPFSLTYDKQLYGDFLMAGNAVLGCPPDGTPAHTGVPCADGQTRTNRGALNDWYSMRQVDVDSDPQTFNSSQVQITIPAGSAVDFARLYWAGNTGLTHASDGTPITGAACSASAGAGGLPRAAKPPAPAAANPAAQQVRMTIGTGTPANIAPVLTSEPAPNRAESQYYSALADVTAKFAGAPTGSPLTITVGNVWTPSGFNCFGGWSLTIVYKYPAPNPQFAPYLKRVYIWDGHVRQDRGNPPTEVTADGFSYTGGDIRAGVTAYEGDWGIPGDQLLINGKPMPEGFRYSQTDNFFTSNADGGSNPRHLNNYSIDTGDFPAPDGTIKAGDTSAKLAFTTSGDSYLGQQLVLSVPVPLMEIRKEVCQGGTAQACGPGGAGPWGEEAVVSTGGTAYWRITVTNPGGVDITGARLTDDDEPGCVKAAGTFDLPRLTSKTFYCQTENITGKKVNRASTVYPPPLVPTPTPVPPIVIPPDSATVKPGLADTGLKVGAIALLGLALAGAGLLVRRLARERS